MKQENKLVNWPEDLLDELLDKNNNLIYDYRYVVKNFNENWDYIKNTLSEREVKCIELRFKEGLNLEEIGKELGITKERVRQIISRGIRRLSHSSRLNILIKGYKNIEECKSLREEIRNELINLRNKYNELLNVKSKEDINDDLKKELNSPECILIEDLDFSVRTYNCLKRANINTVDKIIKLSEYELDHIRNLGRKSAREICDKVRDLGFKMSFDYDDDDETFIDLF